MIKICVAVIPAVLKPSATAGATAGFAKSLDGTALAAYGTAPC